MPRKITTENIVECGNTLHTNVVIDSKFEYGRNCLESNGLIINDVVNIQFKCECFINTFYDQRNTLIFLKFTKLKLNDDVTYTIKVLSHELAFSNTVLIGDVGIWFLILETLVPPRMFDMKFVINENKACQLSILHEDSHLTDFEMRTEGGSVWVHRAILAAYSPVLQTMLRGQWKEAIEGHIYMAGTSCTTLQHLKDYMYMHRLPKTRLKQLLLLASYYMISDLEQKCIDELVQSLTTENTFDMLEFAVMNKIVKLSMAILKCLQRSQVKIADVHNFLVSLEKVG